MDIKGRKPSTFSHKFVMLLELLKGAMTYFVCFKEGGILLAKGVLTHLRESLIYAGAIVIHFG